MVALSLTAFFLVRTVVFTLHWCRFPRIRTDDEGWMPIPLRRSRSWRCAARGADRGPRPRQPLESAPPSSRSPKLGPRGAKASREIASSLSAPPIADHRVDLDDWRSRSVSSRPTGSSDPRLQPTFPVSVCRSRTSRSCWPRRFCRVRRSFRHACPARAWPARSWRPDRRYNLYHRRLVARL